LYHCKAPIRTGKSNGQSKGKARTATSKPYLTRFSAISYFDLPTRAPAFLDQSSYYIADGVNSGRFYAVGDKSTKWSYVLTGDFAPCLAKAAVYPEEDINNQTIDIGWSDGPKSQEVLAKLVSEVTKTLLSTWVVPWLVFQLLVYPIKLFSELGYDMMRMFLFFKKGSLISDIAKQEHFFGPAPASKEDITKWTESNKLKL
jgi:uncharacterized protein YbjT (DUF2867 family)